MPILLDDLKSTLDNLKQIVGDESTRQLTNDPADVFVHFSSCVHAHCNCKSGEVYVFVEKRKPQRHHVAVDLELDTASKQFWRTDSRSVVFPVGSKVESGLSYFAAAWGSRLLGYQNRQTDLPTATAEKLDQHRKDKGQRFHWKTQLSRSIPTRNDERVAIEVAVKIIDDSSRANLENRQSVIPDLPLFDHNGANHRDEVSARLRFPFH